MAHKVWKSWACLSSRPTSIEERRPSNKANSPLFVQRNMLASFSRELFRYDFVERLARVLAEHGFSRPVGSPPLPWTDKKRLQRNFYRFQLFACINRFTRCVKRQTRGLRRVSKYHIRPVPSIPNRGDSLYPWLLPSTARCTRSSRMSMLH